MAIQRTTDSSDSQETPSEQKAHIRAILEKLSDVMFLTYQSKGGPPAVSARPLHVTRLDDDGTMWFMVGLDSGKVMEVKRHEGVFITGQDGKRWIHVTGRAEVVTDRGKIRDLWKKLHEAWFPEGPEDPNVCLVRFVPEAAQYWDNSGNAGVRYLFEAARALVTGTAAKSVKGAHGEVETKL